ncbi:MAG: hypothetical protein IH584_07965 [Candidatus Aminicenantes bacterium]|nr:hypothetical protein [Candidatus Aminicenantes bacterium]
MKSIDIERESGTVVDFARSDRYGNGKDLGYGKDLRGNLTWCLTSLSAVHEGLEMTVFV